MLDSGSHEPRSRNFEFRGSVVPPRYDLRGETNQVSTDSFIQRPRVDFECSVDRVDRSKLAELKTALEDFPGPCPVTLELLSNAAWGVTMEPTAIRVDPSEDLMNRLERLFGEKVCELR